MISPMAAFGVAVGGISLISYLLMTRLENNRAIRRRSGGTGGGYDAGGTDWIIPSWFGRDHSPSCDSAPASDASVGDSGASCDGGSDGGGSDGGGGDGGGGGD